MCFAVFSYEVVLLQFADAETAEGHATSSTDFPTLCEGNVLVLSAVSPPVEIEGRDYLDQLQAECGCGEIFDPQEG